MNEPLKDSMFFRGYCIRCGTPMRVATEKWTGFCERCDPPTPSNRLATITPRQRVGLLEEEHADTIS